MSLNESIVEEAAFEWFLLRSAPLNYGGQVGELTTRRRFFSNTQYPVLPVHGLLPVDVEHHYRPETSLFRHLIRHAPHLGRRP